MDLCATWYLKNSPRFHSYTTGSATALTPGRECQRRASSTPAPSPTVEAMADLLFILELTSSRERDARLRITGHLRKTLTGGSTLQAPPNLLTGPRGMGAIRATVVKY